MPTVRSEACLTSVLLLVLLPGGPARSTEQPGPSAADILLTHATVLTVDPADSIAESIAIRGGKIVAVGANAELSRWIGPETRVLDLRGLTVTPGLIDSHCHLASGGLSARLSLDLRFPAVRSIADLTRRVREAVPQRSPEEWILGDGWDEGKLEERRYVYASDLDPVSGQRPAWLTHTMGHYGTANSRALGLAGIDRGTPDPPGGTIDRLPDGRPSGVLKEAAMDLVRRLVPEPTLAQQADAIAWIMQQFSEEGMTAIKDPGIDRQTWDAYRAVRSDGRSTLRVFALWRAGDTLDAARRLVDEIADFTWPRAPEDEQRLLVSGGIKMAIDGSGGARTAWVHEEWNKSFTDVDRGNRGYPLVDPRVFREQFKLFHDAGLHVGVHAIGDRGIDWVVDTISEALQAKPTRGLRHGVIHCNVPSRHALETIARLQKEYDAAYPEASATFMWWIGDTYAGNWGPARSRRLNPFKTFRERGILWGGGSDFDVTPFPARYGIWASVRRQALLGVYGADPYGRDESVDVRTALRSFTAWNARQLFLEGEIGTIEAGKSADLAVWDRNPYAVPIDEVKEMKCLMTFLAGKLVHRAPGAPQFAPADPARVPQP